MTDFNDDKGTPGGWGEYFAAVSGLSVMMQSGKYRNYDEVLAAINEMNTNTDNKYTALATLINNHISNQNNGDHKLSSLDIGKGLVDNLGTASATQTGTDFDNLFTTPANAATYASIIPSLGTNDNVHKQNLNPISTYGDKTWLPVNVTKDYSGATAISAHAPEINMIEDNSTYMGLHAGTNGVTRGLYYHYLPDAARRGDQKPVRNTHHKYTPSGLTSGDATSVISTDGRCIVGRITGGTATGFVSIVGVDLDPGNHKTAFITLPFTEAFDTFSTACVAGDYVYLFRGPITTSGNTSKSLTVPHEFLVYRIQISTMTGGGNAAVVPIIGWSTSGMYGTSSGDTIRLADKLVGSTTAEKPLMLHDNASWLMSLDPLNCNLRIYAEANPDNPNQIRLGVHHTAKATTTAGTTAYGFMAYSLLLTAMSASSGNTATLEDNGKPLTVASGNAGTIALSSASMTNPRNIIGIDTYVGWANCCATRSGYILTRYNGLVKNSNCTYTKSKIIGFVDRFTSLRYKTLSLQTVVSARITVDTETDFTANMSNPRSLPGGYVMMNGMGRSQPDQGNYTRGKRVFVPGPIATTYPTVNTGNALGWANSSIVNDYATDRSFNQCIFISRSMSTNTTISCDSSVMYRGGAGAGVTIASDGTIGGTFTYDVAEAENVIYNALKTITGRQDIFRYDWVVYVSQDSGIPVTVVAAYTLPNGVNYSGGHVMFELNHGGARTGNFTGYTYKKLCKQVTYSATGKDVWLDVESMGGYQHFMTGDSDRLASIGCPVVIEGLSTDPNIIGLRRDIGIIFFGVVRGNASGTWETSTIKTLTHDNYPGGVTPSGVANSAIGLGIVNYAVNNANYNTLMVISGMATTYVQFVAWTAYSDQTMTAQKKNTAASFAFYGEEPVFIAGREHRMARKVVNLLDVSASPNGKIFYVGVLLSESVASYDVSLTIKDTSISYMPLGTVYVDNNGLVSFTLRKPIRVDVYEMHAYRHGSGIPVTEGSPQVDGVFHWIDPNFSGVTFTYYDASGSAHNAYGTDYNIAWIVMNYNLKSPINNVTVTIEELDGPDEDLFLYQTPDLVWHTKSMVVSSATVPVGGSLRINTHINDDFNIARRVTSRLRVRISYGEFQYTKNTDLIGHTLVNPANAQIIKHVVSGTLQPGATARIKLGGEGKDYYWDQAVVQHGGSGFPSGDAPNGLSITMPRIYDNPARTTVVTPLNTDVANPSQHIFQRAGKTGSGNVTGCGLNMDVGDSVYAKVVTPNPVNGSPWFANSGPIIELNNYAAIPTAFRLLVGNIIGNAPPTTTKLLDTWALEHMPPWYFDDAKIFFFSLETDDSGYFDIDFKTGDVTIALNNDRRNYTNDVIAYPSGEVWTPGLRGVGYEDYRNYVTATKNYPGLAFGSNLPSISTLSIRLGEQTGRNQIYVQRQPTAANNYVARVFVKDPDNGTWGYTTNIYLTATNKPYDGVLRNVDVELVSIAPGPVVIHPADMTWNIRIRNRSTTNIVNMPLDILLSPATSGDGNNLTLGTTRAAAGSSPVYNVVTTKSVPIIVAAGATVDIPIGVYGNSIVRDGFERYSQYNVDVNMVLTLSYGNEVESTPTSNYHVEYIDRTADIDIVLTSVNQPSATAADTVWSFKVDSVAGTDLSDVTVTYERIVTPANTNNNGLTFSDETLTPVANGFRYKQESSKAFTFTLGSSSVVHNLTLLGNARYVNNSGTLDAVDDKYDVDLGMKVTVAQGGKSRTFTLTNSIHVKTN